IWEAQGRQLLADDHRRVTGFHAEAKLGVDHGPFLYRLVSVTVGDDVDDRGNADRDGRRAGTASIFHLQGRLEFEDLRRRAQHKTLAVPREVNDTDAGRN